MERSTWQQFTAQLFHAAEHNFEKADKIQGLKSKSTSYEDL